MATALQELINQKTIAAKNARAKQQEKAKTDFDKRTEALQPMFAILSESLPEYGLDVHMHTDTSHYPCPAIHVRGHVSGHSIYEDLGEIFIPSHRDDNKWRAGACNTHRNGFKNDEDFLEFVASRIAALQAR